MCLYGEKPETTLHYLLRCNSYSIYWLELFNNIFCFNQIFKEFFGRKFFENFILWSRSFTSQMNSGIVK